MKSFKEYIVEAKSKGIVKDIENVIDKNIVVYVGGGNPIGYSSYAEKDLGTKAVELTDKGVAIFVEWQAEDKKEAINVAKKVSKEVSKLLGSKVEFDVDRDIWGVEDKEELWYVTIDEEIELPL